jgi:hypothetical protein
VLSLLAAFTRSVSFAAGIIVFNPAVGPPAGLCSGAAPAGYDDVAPDSRDSEFILFLSARGIVSGVGNSLFAPERVVSRAEFVKMLALTAGEPRIDAPLLFEDVSAADWFSPYVNWAAESRVAFGYGGGKFGPNDPLTREQMCKMVAFYAAFTGCDFGIGMRPSIWNDEADISGWALESVRLVQQAGLLGDGIDENLKPQGAVTRTEAAAVVCRLLLGLRRAADNTPDNFR